MLRRGAFFLFLLASSVLPAQEAVPRLSIAYEVAVADPQSGSISVTMDVRQNVEDEVRVSIPAWAPGAYRIVKYAKAVKEVRANRGDEALEVTAGDDQTWKIKAKRAGTFKIRYDLSVEKGRMDRDHCFIAGPDTYFYVVGHKEAPCRVRFAIPEGWKVGTGLGRDGEDYAARDYDTFIDCPTELGKFELFEFTTDKAKYELVVHAKGPVDGEKLVEMCRKIVREQNRIFGAPPFERYVFLYHFRDGIGGRGLEHLNSTDIVMPYSAIRNQPLTAASVTSHEYFHLWNVKRIRPFELGPFDYTGIVRSRHLWLCEGVTSYFGDRSLERCGIWSEDLYFTHLADEITTLQNNPDRLVTPVEKASQVVWDRKDWPRVDYYNKGELLGLLIDLKIRTATEGRKTIDDVLRHLFETHVVRPSKEGKGAIGVGFPEDGVLQAINHVSGGDWKDFYAKYISGVEELPYTDILGAAGIQADIAVVNLTDLGGADLRSTFVVSVPPGSEAEKAGIKTADRVTELNGVEVTRTNIREELAKLKVGDEAKAKILRGSDTFDVAVKVGAHARTSCKLRRADAPTELQKKILDGWLHRPSDF
jgi:predicted metalloprotease with PDZ domain